MELVLKRSYFEEGSNGTLFLAGQLICYCIELPWQNNIRLQSCIPEGKYRLKKRYSPRFKWHLQVVDVPQREHILLHPANHALRELRGCIAPVQQLSGPGKGLNSRIAFQQLKQLLYPVFKRREPVFLIINS